MKAGFSGRRIALLEARLAGPLAELVRRQGGEPVCVPAVSDRRSHLGVLLAPLLYELQAEPDPVFVFTSGAGVAALFDEARALSLEPALRDALIRGTTICRGPKPVAALRGARIKASMTVPSPCTTAEMLAALDEVPLEGRLAVLVHYGERSPQLAEALLLDEWEFPEDLRPLEQLVRELIAGAYAAAAFTSQIQARHLLELAEQMGARNALLAALRRVVVAAVGPTCAQAMRELGIEPQVVPENPKMGPMLEALACRLAGRESAT